MSTPQNAATDVFQSWTTTIQAVGVTSVACVAQAARATTG